MRIKENAADWYAEYRRDILTAQAELALNFPVDPLNLIGDIYCLPAHNHQTFLCRVICEGGFMKLVYAKAVQNSIWFSEPIYMYRFEEAKSFADHPIRRGRIVCGKKLIRKTAVDHFLTLLGAVSDKQPDGLVTPALDSELTAIRLYENGKVVREIAFTDAERLVFRDGADTSTYTKYLQGLHLFIERMIGVGSGTR